MSFRTDLAADVAALHVDLSSDLGVSLTYIARGVPIAVVGSPMSSESGSMRVWNGTRSVEKYRAFEIATQTNFPPAGGLTIDDVIVDEWGEKYRVKTFVNKDDIHAVWLCEGVNTRTKQVGAVDQ